MQEKSEVSYSTWKEAYVQKLESDNAGRHGYQNHFYGKLLIENFEAQFADILPSLKVNEQFTNLVALYSSELRAAYGYEWDTSKVESSTHPKFLEFIDKLNEQGFLFKKEIKKFAPLFVQGNRTSPNGFLSQLPKDYLSELANYLEPHQSPQDAVQTMKDELQKAQDFYQQIRMFSYDAKEVAFSKQNGTQVTLDSSDAFEKWFSTLPLKTPVQLNEKYSVFKLDDNTLAMNSGPGTRGIQIKREGNSFIACNNQAADRAMKAVTQEDLALERNANLATSLAELKKALQTEPKKEVANEKSQPFSYNDKEIAFSKQNGTQVTLDASDYSKKWFATFPLKTSVQLNENYVIFKLDDNTLAINSGPGTPGIRIKREGNFFIACNNLAADRAVQGLTQEELTSARNANLVASLTELNRALQAKPKEQAVVAEKTEVCSVQ
ncbi:hypothetical protein BN59_00714 [Legionella massiliensis]|uniref:Uncharacterized protein n=1 Tax=Legionella massiliensis TaxID=1034943 RepID=A0A078KQ06_9GAMM|nr:hypothetical protein [Legionella massiliensis]CDZ76445.1 hypothetical protein BN59_00714 [Legionella massiliensis]CEE12183.1 hypothetical protein BN1094_00714 [Legionella massiliensis]